MDAKSSLQEAISSPVRDAGGTTAIARPPLWRMGWIWFMLGLQSFGGGTATLFMIRRAAVEQHRWISPEEFTRDWALVQAAPGINLLCMTILVGHRVAGFVGGLVSLVGLMLPSVAITVVMTALYADLRNLPVIQAALRGIVPATVGLGLVLTVRMVIPLLKARGREGRLLQVVYLLILLGSTTVALLWNLPVIVMLIGAGMIGGTAQWLHNIRDHQAQGAGQS